MAFTETGNYLYLVIFLTINFYLYLLDNRLTITDVFYEFKSWLYKVLLKNRKRERIIPWMILISLINNFILEPVTTLLDEIPYGAIQNTPKVYQGEWYDEHDYLDVKIYIQIYKNKLKNVLIDADGEAHILWCKPSKIYYNFRNLDYFYYNKIWYPALNIFSELFIPATLFGMQQIRWECENSPYSIYTSEPFKEGEAQSHKEFILATGHVEGAEFPYFDALLYRK